MLAPITPITLSPAVACACARALSMPSGTTVNIGAAPASGRWVTTKHGTSPSGPESPQDSVELSYERRPMITAPVSFRRSPYTCSKTDGSSNIQLWRRMPSSPRPWPGVSFGAAM